MVGVLGLPNCWRTWSLMRADKSALQVGQAKETGWRTISGVASKAYFAPQSQMIFIIGQGLGLSSTTFGPSGKAIAAVAGDCSVLPSENKNTPPYL